MMKACRSITIFLLFLIGFATRINATLTLADATYTLLCSPNPEKRCGEKVGKIINTTNLHAKKWTNDKKIDMPHQTVAHAVQACRISKNAPEYSAYPSEVTGDSLKLPSTHTGKKGGFTIRTVVIDPGHGGHDPGCSGVHSKEKHNCLAIGKYFAEVLKINFPDLKIIMTRNADVFVPLKERAAIATRNQADLFISIHCNFIPNASHVHGTETYVLGLHATNENLEVAKRENAAILYEDHYQETYGYDPNSPEAHIVFSMFQNAFLDQSILFAQKVQKSMSDEAGRKDKGVKQAGFLVLRHATMPSVLVETGYLSNYKEENYLRSKKGRKTIANALLQAFHDYKKEVEGWDKPLALKKLDLTPEEDEPEPQEAALPETPQVVVVRQETSTVKNYSPSAKGTPTDLTDKPMPGNEPVAISPKKDSSGWSRPVSSPTPLLPKSESPAPAAQPKNSSKEEVKETIHVSQSGTKIIPSTPVSVGVPSAASDIQEKSKNPAASPSYRVQLAASPVPLNISEGKWLKVDHLIEVIQEDKLYKYQICNFASHEDANQVRLKLKNIGFSDAFVVQYQNGRRLYPGSK